MTERRHSLRLEKKSHGVYLPHFPHPFLCCWVTSSQSRCCREHWCTGVCPWRWFGVFGVEAQVWYRWVTHMVGLWLTTLRTDSKAAGLVCLPSGSLLSTSLPAFVVFVCLFAFEWVIRQNVSTVLIGISLIINHLYFPFWEFFAPLIGPFY